MWLLHHFVIELKVLQVTNNQSILERINSKLNDILAGLRLLEKRVRRIEKDINDNNINVNEKFTKGSKFFIILYIYYIYTYFLYILEYY